ncbi:MAG: transcription elongation factor GreA [Candidatus Cloacimonetes bacterium]|nr:transcription elongation factor GreA [Candidatus Cloacimonadota bacterium]
MAREYISKAGLEKLRQRLEYLIQEERPAIIEEIGKARQFGDLSENAEYHAAKEKQRFIEAEISKLQAKIASLKVINTDDIDKNSIRFGATVELQDLKRNKVLRYKIVGEDETGKMGNVRMISFKSPIAKALLGKDVGEIVKVSAPVGILEYKINNITYEE